MPNRILRDGILSSPRVDRIADSPAVEVTYRRLISAVDDYGRFSAHATQLRAALYPRRIDKISDAEIINHLTACEQAGLIRLYRVGEEAYLELLDFRQAVRAKKSKWPADVEQMSSTCVADEKQMSRTCEQMRPNSETYSRDERRETTRSGAPSHDQPAELQSLNGPLEWFTSIWPGPIPEDIWRTFGERVNTLERLAALQVNTPLWAQTKKYKDGFSDGNAFLRSGVWLSPPKPELLPAGDVFDRAIASSREDPGE